MSLDGVLIEFMDPEDLERCPLGAGGGSFTKDQLGTMSLSAEADRALCPSGLCLPASFWGSGVRVRRRGFGDRWVLSEEMVSGR